MPAPRSHGIWGPSSVISATSRCLPVFFESSLNRLWYKEIVGGVLAVSITDYKTINGYSNLYWAWGGEDDDMGTYPSSCVHSPLLGKRILSLNYTIERPDPDVARYSMLKHVKRQRTAPKLM